MDASRKKAVGEVFGGGLPTKSSKIDRIRYTCPVILAQCVVMPTETMKYLQSLC
jgi:hypothetical protein